MSIDIKLHLIKKKLVYYNLGFTFGAADISSVSHDNFVVNKVITEIFESCNIAKEKSDGSR